MNDSRSYTKSVAANLATHPGCLGRTSAVLAPFVDFYRHLCRALESLPYEYKSPRKFLGLPLLSINLGFDNPQGKMRQASGIIAIGNQATGIIALGVFIARGLFTIAPIAIGLVSVSIVSLALLSVSVFGLGLVSVSIFAVGYLAVGMLAVGYKCVGILAIGKEAIGIIGIGQTVRSVFPP